MSYEQWLRDYLEITKLLRKHIKKEQAGSYWREDGGFFKFLGKVIHETEQEIQLERICSDE